MFESIQTIQRRRNIFAKSAGRIIKKIFVSLFCVYVSFLCLAIYFHLKKNAFKVTEAESRCNDRMELNFLLVMDRSTKIEIGGLQTEISLIYFINPVILTVF